MKYVERKLYRPTHLALLPMATWISLGGEKIQYKQNQNVTCSDDNLPL